LFSVSAYDQIMMVRRFSANSIFSLIFVVEISVDSSVYKNLIFDNISLL